MLAYMEAKLVQQPQVEKWRLVARSDADREGLKEGSLA
jgi:hypothetical protein